MSVTSAPETTGTPGKSSRTQPGSIMDDLRAESGVGGKEKAKNLAGVGSVDKVLDSDVASKGINVAQQAASRKAGDLASTVGGTGGSAVAQDTTKVAGETVKGAVKGAGAGGVGAAPGAVLGAAKGAAQTRTGRWLIALALGAVVLYWAAISLLPLLMMMAVVDGGEESEQRDNVNEVTNTIYGS